MPSSEHHTVFDLAKRFQAERWGAELFPDDVELLDLNQRPFLIRTSEGEVRCHPKAAASKGILHHELSLSHDLRIADVPSGPCHLTQWLNEAAVNCHPIGMMVKSGVCGVNQRARDWCQRSD